MTSTVCTTLSVAHLYLQDQEKGHLQQLQSLMPSYRARPSLLGPLAAAAGFSLGAAAGVLPTRFAHAITGDPHDMVIGCDQSASETVMSCFESVETICHMQWTLISCHATAACTLTGGIATCKCA